MYYTVHSPLFFRKIIETDRFVLRAAILHECQNYFLAPSSPHQHQSYNSQRPSPRYIWKSRYPWR